MHPETWMLYPLLILGLLGCVCDAGWIPAWVLFEMAVILDWGEFLYELPVLPGTVHVILYLGAAVLAAGVFVRNLVRVKNAESSAGAKDGA